MAKRQPTMHSTPNIQSFKKLVHVNCIDICDLPNISLIISWPPRPTFGFLRRRTELCLLLCIKRTLGFLKCYEQC